MAEEEALFDTGTRFPFINLEKAIGRAQQLFQADQRGREMTTTAAFGVWDYSEKSSGGFQTIAALKMYGLIRSGSGKVGLSDAALRYFRDEREDERQKLLSDFALKPKLIASLWKDWGAAPPADTIARSHLKSDREMPEQNARSLLSIYKENIAFAGLTADDKPIDAEPEKEDDSPASGASKDRRNPPPPPPPGQVKIMSGERVAFVEEGQPGQYLKVIASGDVDDTMLEALEDFVKRQRKRLGAASARSIEPEQGSASLALLKGRAGSGGNNN